MITLLSRIAAVCLLLLATCLAGAAPASATGTDGTCPAGGGVTVVVDFGDLAPQPLVRCAPGTPATGIAALQGAGIDVAGSQKYGLAIACRIDGKPGPDVESCAGMPSATAYWSYWHAAAGGKWESSQEGAQTSKPHGRRVRGLGVRPAEDRQRPADAAAGGAGPPGDVGNGCSGRLGREHRLVPVGRGHRRRGDPVDRRRRSGRLLAPSPSA